ncbi:MAG: hypothetical protein OEZ04_12635, partial [Nitrospinota bacterium]|nr:hypothetical protein [Nitrospinota bacterium]
MKIKLVHTVTVIAHGVDPHAPALPYTPTKSSPGYDDSIPRFKIIKDWAPMETGGISAECRIKSFRDIFVIVEAAATAQDGPAASALEIKNALNILAAEMAAKYGDTRLSEEFTFYCHSGYSNLDPYIKERAHDIAKLLKDESIELTDEEAAKTFEGSVRYEPDDLTVV